MRARGDLPNQSDLAMGLALSFRKAQLKKTRIDVCIAMEQGRFIAISDACIASGQAAVAWGIWAPTGQWLSGGALAVELTERGSSSQAESMGAIVCAGAMRDLDIPKALILCDCAPAIDRLLGSTPSADDAHAAWKKASAGMDWQLKWAPREWMGPANDAARHALGLRPEKSSRRLGSDWSIAHGREARGVKIKF